jgi:hypothetical protein
MMITKGLVSVNDLLNSCQKRAWVMVKGNEGGINFETPQTDPDLPTKEFQTQG